MNDAAKNSGRSTNDVTTSGTRRVTLALQGGGSHGAFTWGVLDRLLEEPTLEVVAVSGTSAGAMNGAVLVYGLKNGGRAAAKEKLSLLWKGLSAATVFNPYRTGWNPFTGWNIDGSPVTFWLNVFALAVSPYDNPFYKNALEAVIDSQIEDFHVFAGGGPHIFVSATNVLTNERMLFDDEALARVGAKVLLASACLPQTFQAVVIDGQHYWDGGFIGNPALEPLTYCAEDIIIVDVNPRSCDQVPVTAGAILDRVNEVTFNASLLLEIYAIECRNRWIREGRLVSDSERLIRFHQIEAERKMMDLGHSSKNNTNMAFLNYLFEIGRQSADTWVKRKLSDVGVRSSVNVQQTLLKPLHWKDKVTVPEIRNQTSEN